LQFLTSAYSQQQQQLEQQRQNAIGTFTDFLSKFVDPATGKSNFQAAGQYLTSLYGAQNLAAMGIDVNNLEKSFGGLQPLSAYSSTLHYGQPGGGPTGSGGYDLSSYNPSNPNYPTILQNTASSYGAISDPASAQAVIDRNSIGGVKSPIT